MRVAEQRAQRFGERGDRVPFGEGPQRLGQGPDGTKVLATKVSGKIATKATPWTASGPESTLPMSTPTQIIAKAKRTISP